MSGMGYKDKLNEFGPPKPGQQAAIITATLDNPCVPGSIIFDRPCDTCGEKVWASPSTQAMIKSGVIITHVFCIDCFKPTETERQGMEFRMTGDVDVVKKEWEALKVAERAEAARAGKIPGANRRKKRER